MHPLGQREPHQQEANQTHVPRKKRAKTTTPMGTQQSKIKPRRTPSSSRKMTTVPTLPPKIVSQKNLSTELVAWYRQVARPLPWRASRDPYKVWISEVMLQQTTVTAVVPFFHRFMERFPNLATLAKAHEAEVIAQWAGLGYYTRARLLWRAAQILNDRGGFPQQTAELLALPGFGPYTARAVASIAFNEAVGVVDGNVIRVLCRHFGLNLKWWLPLARQQLQDLADRLVIGQASGEVNQALMELGASLCRPQTPTCVLCPWRQSCVAREKQITDALPLKKMRRAKEIWVWNAQLLIRKDHAALVKNDYAPFLSGQWIWPGSVKKREAPPRQYHFRHSITHHDIYVALKKVRKKPDQAHTWVALEQLAQVSPTSLMKKTLKFRA